MKLKSDVRFYHIKLNQIRIPEYNKKEKYQIMMYGVSEDELTQAFIDYREMLRRRKFVHYGPEYIISTEDLSERQNALIDGLKCIFKFSDWQVSADRTVLDIIIADRDENERIISDFVSERGFIIIPKSRELINDNISFKHLLCASK